MDKHLLGNAAAVATIIGTVVTIIVAVDQWRASSKASIEERTPKREKVAHVVQTQASSTVVEAKTMPSVLNSSMPSSPARVAIQVTGDAAQFLQNPLKAAIQTDFAKHGIEIADGNGSNLTHVIKISVNSNSRSNADTYGSSMYSATCSGSVLISDLKTKSVVADTLVDASKPAVAFDADSARNRCVNELVGPLEVFLSKTAGILAKTN